VEGKREECKPPSIAYVPDHPHSAKSLQKIYTCKNQERQKKREEEKVCFVAYVSQTHKSSSSSSRGTCISRTLPLSPSRTPSAPNSSEMQVRSPNSKHTKQSQCNSKSPAKPQATFRDPYRHVSHPPKPNSPSPPINRRRRNRNEWVGGVGVIIRRGIDDVEVSSWESFVAFGVGCVYLELSAPEPAVHEKIVLVHLLLLLFPWRSDGPASVHATVNVLLFLLCWFQNLFV